MTCTTIEEILNKYCPVKSDSLVEVTVDGQSEFVFLRGRFIVAIKAAIQELEQQLRDAKTIQLAEKKILIKEVAAHTETKAKLESAEADTYNNPIPPDVEEDLLADTRVSFL